MRGPGPSALLQRAITTSARASAVEITIGSVHATDWASATFCGARHVIDGHAPATAAIDHWLAVLPEADLPLRGHLVADLVIAGAARDGARHCFTIEVLTVEST